MNRNKYGFICVVAVTMLMLASGCGMRTRVITPDSEEYESIPLFAQCLIEAYPNEIVGYADDHLVWNDGTTLLYDDGLDKSVQEMLEEGDNEDMSYWLYTNVIEPFNPNRSLGRLLYPFSIF